MNPLFRMALLKGSVSSVLMHLKRGAPVDAPDDRGMTPLMVAASTGRDDVCALLLDEGADARIAIADRTAADIAEAAGHLEIARFLTHSQRGVEQTAEAAALTGPSTSDQLDEWVAEEQFAEAAPNPALVEALSEVQRNLATARPVKGDIDWSELLIKLPEYQPIASDKLLSRVLDLLETALHDQLLGEPGLAPLCKKIPGLQRLADYLDAVTDADPFRQRLFGNSYPGQSLSRQFDEEAITEALDALRSWRPAADALRFDLARVPSLDRHSEQSMFRSLREAKRQIVIALVEALPIAGAIFGPSDRAENASGVDGLPRDNALPEADDDGIEPDDDVLAADDLFSSLRAIRDNRRQPVLRELVEFDLNLGMVSRVERALVAENDELHARLSAATERYVQIRNRITEATMPLTFKYVEWYVRPGIPVEDLLQVAGIGVMRAVERFDIERGNRFLTYAIWWIRRSCNRWIDDTANTIRVPVHRLQEIRRYEAAQHRLRAELAREPTPDDLALALELNRDQVRRLQHAILTAISISEPEMARIFPNLVARTGCPHEDALASNAREVAGRILNTLNERQEHILRSRFGFGVGEEETLEEIGRRMSLTRERIRQIEAKALSALTRRKDDRGRSLRALW